MYPPSLSLVFNANVSFICSRREMDGVGSLQNPKLSQVIGGQRSPQRKLLEETRSTLQAPINHLRVQVLYLLSAWNGRICDKIRY